MASDEAGTQSENGRGWRAALTSSLAVGAALSVLVLAAVTAVVVHVTHRAPVATATVGASAAQAGVAVSLQEMRIEPSRLVVAAGSHLVLRVTNKGSLHHDLRLSDGKQTARLAPGQTAVLDVGVVDGPLDGWCTVVGHRQAGMQMKIQVSSASVVGSGAMRPEPTTALPTAAKDAVSPDLTASPAPGWTPIDATLPDVGTTTVHDVTWHIRAVVRTVAPGVRQQVWTFDGSVPGPALHGRVGDTFNVTVVNDTDMDHTVDFHAESGPPATTMSDIPPRATHTYSFVVAHAGAWLYHCGTEPMLQHMGNGMYGALIVDPPGLRAADAQYVLVGSELFFGPQGQPGDYAKMLVDKPDAVVFNGYPFAYRHAPLHAEVGQRVRIWVVDAGPTRSFAFHVVGASFDTEYLDGHYDLDAGSAASGAAQTLPVDPGDGGFVELTFDQPGKYPFLSHAMADATLGASGTMDVSS